MEMTYKAVKNEAVKEFERGVDDCKNGFGPRSAMADYMAGYGYQYELEARQDAGTEGLC